MSGFLESTLRGFSRVVAKALVSEQTATHRGLLQTFDPRVRVVSIIVLVLALTLCRKLEIVIAMFFLALLIAIGSKISLSSLAKRVWLIVFGFTGMIALPAIFITPGEVIGHVGPLAITRQGVLTALLLLFRVETAVTLTTALVLSTQWTAIMRALRSLYVPAEVVTMLAMTHRYIFLLAETANQMFESRLSRMVGVPSTTEQRRIVGRTAGVLLTKSMDLSGDIYAAMQSRGFAGEVRLLSRHELGVKDYGALVVVVLSAALIVWVGR